MIDNHSDPIENQDLSGPRTEAAQSGGQTTPLEIWQPGKILLGEYRIESILGKGGMGTVYLVRSQSFDTDVYAMKTLSADRLGDPVKRRSFMREIRTWIDLPPHTNLTPCLFVRTIEDRLTIFSQVVSGGSLRSWVLENKLTSVPEILDIAIQIARGLHCAHSRGMVHQDVKSGNVLMDTDGTARVTDFGLAGLRFEQTDRSSTTGDSGKGLVTTCGMTPAYCSPEQAAQERLSHATDIWSWGVTILEMFTSGVTWQVGILAPAVLEEYIRNPPSGRPSLPEGCAEILQKCFAPDPNDRWASINEAANALIHIHTQITGLPYHRPNPEIQLSRPSRKASPLDRRTISGYPWDDPEVWRKKVYTAAGTDPPPVTGAKHYAQLSRRARGMADLEHFIEIHQLYRSMITGGRTDLQAELGRFLMQMSLIQKDIGDLPGAIQTYDEIINIYTGICNRDGILQSGDDLAAAYMDRAFVMGDCGDDQGAMEFYEKSLEIRRNLVAGDPSSTMKIVLGKTLLNVSNSLGILGQLKTSIAMCNEAIGIFESLHHEPEYDYTAKYEADCHLNKAVDLMDLGQLESALENNHRSIEIYHDLSCRPGNEFHTRDLALAYMNEGNILNRQEKFLDALANFQKAVDLLEKLLTIDASEQVQFDLARVLLNQAGTCWYMNDFIRAKDVNHHAMEILEDLVFQKGHRQYRPNLAMVYMNRALFQQALEFTDDVTPYFQKAIQIWERLIDQENRIELIPDLVLTYYNASGFLSGTGEPEEGLMLGKKALAYARRWVIERGHPEDAISLALAYHCRSSAFSEMKQYPECITALEKAMRILETLHSEFNRSDWDEERISFQLEYDRCMWLIKQTPERWTILQASRDQARKHFESHGGTCLAKVLETIDNIQNSNNG